MRIRIFEKAQPNNNNNNNKNNKKNKSTRRNLIALPANALHYPLPPPPSLFKCPHSRYNEIGDKLNME